MYTFLVAVVVCYCIFSFLFLLLIFWFFAKTGFKSMNSAYCSVFKILNRLRGKKFILLTLHAMSYAALFCCIVLALPLLEVFTGVHIYSSFENGVLNTPFGSFSGDLGNYYFIVSLLGALIVLKAHQYFDMIISILYKNFLVVKENGKWGASNNYN